MYQPYPSGAQMPVLDKPPVPAQIKHAVTAMYVGAAASVVSVVIEILTISATRTAIEKRSHHLTASQMNASQHALIIGFVVSGLIQVAAWLFIARNCKNGNSWARITGTVLFGLATVDTIIGAATPLASAVKFWWPVVWLAGLTAVIFLWQRASTAFFKGMRPQEDHQ